MKKYLPKGANLKDSIPEEKKEMEFSEKERNRQGLKDFSLGAFISLACFLLSYLLISFFVSSYIVRSLVAVFFSILIFRAWDKTTGEVPSPLRGSITSFTIIVLVISLFAGYNHHQSKILPKETVIDSPAVTVMDNNSSKGTVYSGDVWRTSRVFNPGDNVRVKISGGSVKIKDGDRLEEGTFVVPITGTGTLAFVGVDNGPVTIEIL